MYRYKNVSKHLFTIIAHSFLITLHIIFVGFWQNALFMPTFLGNGYSLWFLRLFLILLCPYWIQEPDWRTNWCTVLLQWLPMIDFWLTYITVAYQGERVCFISTQAEKAFIRMKVTRARNKREFKWLQFLFFFSRGGRLANRPSHN